MKPYVPDLGRLATSDDRRDAVHIAVAPVVAGADLSPGAHVHLLGGAAFEGGKPIGIVDPFLKELVREGQRFWLFLYPNTVTSLRHVWTHPAFLAKAPFAAEGP